MFSFLHPLSLLVFADRFPIQSALSPSASRVPPRSLSDPWGVFVSRAFVVRGGPFVYPGSFGRAQRSGGVQLMACLIGSAFVLLGGHPWPSDHPCSENSAAGVFRHRPLAFADRLKRDLIGSRIAGLGLGHLRHLYANARY